MLVLIIIGWILLIVTFIGFVILFVFPADTDDLFRLNFRGTRKR
jgi:TM2 domain-containing membrane protein YozV